MKHYGNNTQDDWNSVYSVLRICYMKINEYCPETFRLHIWIYEQQDAG